MSHGNVTTEIGTCPVCKRDDRPLTRKPPLKDDMPERLACTDEYACLSAFGLLPKVTRYRR